MCHLDKRTVHVCYEMIVTLCMYSMSRRAVYLIGCHGTLLNNRFVTGYFVLYVCYLCKVSDCLLHVLFCEYQCNGLLETTRL